MAGTFRPDWGLLVFRLGYAALLIGWHGWARLGRAWGLVFAGEPWGFVDMVATMGFPAAPVFAVASALAESVAPAFVAVGLFTRWASAFIIFNMGVAFVSEFAKGDPIELPGLYLLGAIVICLTGPGAFSIDGYRKSRR